ncbi:LOW QUALITY PROTEIN: Transposase [Phytophthora palmivora]|uniref:Transposase n=1 Tax=Phytophthora palmivora TaxID=4796 RepID=A0A2P4XBE8_9STRA|nr:LOW QUALITY PROTEIN: Transposase [Phytophthora palmivora]
MRKYIKSGGFLIVTGSTSKPPRTRSLENRFKNIRPNGNPSGEEGIDFFLGDQNLVDYYVSLGGETALDDDGSVDMRQQPEKRVAMIKSAISLNKQTEESWISAKLYRDVGAAYLTVSVTRSIVCNTLSDFKFFFAFLPICFWKQVVDFSKAYAITAGNASRQPIELGELMDFLGIIWYTDLVDKGEMKNYWSDNDELRIFLGLDLQTCRL